MKAFKLLENWTVVGRLGHRKNESVETQWRFPSVVIGTSDLFLLMMKNSSIRKVINVCFIAERFGRAKNAMPIDLNASHWNR